MTTIVTAAAYTAQDLVLDEGQLSAAGSSDRAELYLLEWLSTVEKAANGLDQVGKTFGEVEALDGGQLVRFEFHCISLDR